MVNRLRDLIAAYITRNSNINSWEEIRCLYSVYTYVSFLVIALKSIYGNDTDVKGRAHGLKIESGGAFLLAAKKYVTRKKRKSIYLV